MGSDMIDIEHRAARLVTVFLNPCSDCRVGRSDFLIAAVMNGGSDPYGRLFLESNVLGIVIFPLHRHLNFHVYISFFILAVVENRNR